MAYVEGSATVDSIEEIERPVRIWDLPTRLFHWLLVICVTGSIVSAKVGGNAMEWHFRFGYVIFTLLGFRLAWGVIGGHWSRFSRFFVTPARLRDYLRGGGDAALQAAGHTPLGALSVYSLLALLALQVGSGLFADDEIATSGPLVALVSGATSSALTGWHKNFGQWMLLGLIALHFGSILFYLFRKRQNLIVPMITGDKRLPPRIPESSDGWRQRVLALLVLGASAAFVSVVVQLGSAGSDG